MATVDTGQGYLDEYRRGLGPVVDVVALMMMMMNYAGFISITLPSKLKLRQATFYCRT